MIDEIAISGEIIAAESQLWADEQISTMCFALSGMWFRIHLLVLSSVKAGVTGGEDIFHFYWRTI